MNLSQLNRISIARGFGGISEILTTTVLMNAGSSDDAHIAWLVKMSNGSIKAFVRDSTGIHTADRQYFENKLKEIQKNTEHLYKFFKQMLDA